MRDKIKNAVQIITVIFLSLLASCGIYETGDVEETEQLLYVTISERFGKDVEILLIDSLSITYEENYIDFRKNILKIPVAKKKVKEIALTSPDTGRNLFWMMYPLKYQWDIIYSVAGGLVYAPTAELQSIAVFELVTDSADPSPVTLSLKINNKYFFKDSLFTIKPIDMSRALTADVPFVKSGQNVRLQFDSYDHCYQYGLGNRDMRNLHAMILFDGRLSCESFSRMFFSGKEFQVFFTSLPEFGL